MSHCFTCCGTVDASVYVDNICAFICVYCSIQAQTVGMSNYEFVRYILRHDEYIDFIDQLLLRSEILKIGAEHETSPLLKIPIL